MFRESNNEYKGERDVGLDDTKHRWARMWRALIRINTIFIPGPVRNGYRVTDELSCINEAVKVFLDKSR